MKHFVQAAILLLLTLHSATIEARSRLFGSGELTSTLTTAIAQDKRGYIWVGTEYGLNRLDGERVVQYLHDEHDSLSVMSNTIRSLYCDSEGALWVGCLNGIQCYDERTDTFRRVRFEGTTYTPNVSDIIQLASGEIWLLISHLGVFTLDREAMVARPHIHLIELCGTDRINHFFEDAKHRIWLTTSENGIIAIDSKLEHATHYSLPHKGRISNTAEHITETENGVLVTVGYGSIWLFDEVHRLFIRVEQPHDAYLDVYDLLQCSNGDFLIATFRHGLWRLNTDERRLERYAYDQPTPINSEKVNFTNLFEDREGNLWCGCFMRGALLIDATPSPFKQWDMATIEGLPYLSDHGAVTAIHADTDDTIWCGTQDGSLFHLTAEGAFIDRFSVGSDPSTIYVDSQNRLWVGVGYKGVCQVDRKTGRCTYMDSSNHSRVKCIIEDHNGRLYAALLGAGVWCLDRNSTTAYQLTDRVSEENATLLRNSYINVLCIDSKNRLWIGHYLGVSCYDITNNCFLDVAKDELLNSSICYALAESRDGSMWVGTNNGLYAWNEVRRDYNRYTTENGLSSNIICGIAEDFGGHIWCSTFSGINRLRYEDDKITSYQTGSEGRGREYTRGAYYGNGHTLYFGDSYGITCFTPPIPPINRTLTITLTALYLDNKPVTMESRTESGKPILQQPLAESDHLTLRHNQNSFTLEFSTLTFCDIENIRYRYRLTGGSSELYSTLDGSNRIAYNHLRPGNYTLDIFVDLEGQPTGAKRLTIRIKRPWYSTTFAYICYALIFCSVLCQVIYSYRHRQRQIINEARLRLFADLSHEIRSPMTMILSPIESLLKRPHDSETERALHTMQRNAHRILRLINQFLDIRKLDKGQLQLHCRKIDPVALIKDILTSFELRAEQRRTVLTFTHSGSINELWVDPESIEKVVSNLINNALQYTPEGGHISVILTTDQATNEAVLVVSDTGIGIDEKHLERIFERFYQVGAAERRSTAGFGIGLNLCRLLVELHHGTITAANRSDCRGTVFTVRLPLGCDHFAPEELLIEEATAVKFSPSTTPNSEGEERPKRPVRAKSSCTLLIIDDDEEIRTFLDEELAPYYRLLLAKDGNEGLQIALTELPDLIISDVLMPGLDGLQLVRRLKATTNTNHIPIVLLTSKAEAEDRIEGLETGVDGYMAKPFRVEELRTLIENLLKNRLRLRGKFSGSHQEDKIKKVELRANNDVLMERVMKIVNDHLDNPDLSVEMLAEEVGLSRTQLHRRLKELTGISSGEFIRNIRLKKAAELLTERKVNISQVAYMLGFSSQSHFSTAFRKCYGISPSEYILRNEKSEE